MNTECGILGIFSKNDEEYRSTQFIDCLEKLQHRGQESAGICYKTTNSSLYVSKGLGLVKDVFNYNSNINSDIFIGHVRYSTSGKSKYSSDDIKYNEAQPYLSNDKKIAFVYNGNIPSKRYIELTLENKYNDKYTDKYNNKEINTVEDDNIKDDNLDTNTIINFINQRLEPHDSGESKMSLYDILKQFIEEIHRAYNLIILYCDKMYIVRDRYGTRPLCMVENDDFYMISSESVAIDPTIINKNGDYNNKYNLYHIKPGELIEISKSTGVRKEIVKDIQYKAHCLFEYIYFMKPDSYNEIDNTKIISKRHEFGRELARQEKEKEYNMFPEDKDNIIVVGSPNSGIECGKGYAKEMGFNYIPAIEKNKNSNRTFIMENYEKRQAASLKKYIIIKEHIKDKIVIVCDDSIVRGITTKNIVKMLFNAGALEVHLRIAAPQIRNPCYFGVDIPTRGELIANKYNGRIDGINSKIGSTSIIYLDIVRYENILPIEKFCTGCFNGNYNNSNYLEW